MQMAELASTAAKQQQRKQRRGGAASAEAPVKSSRRTKAKIEIIKSCSDKFLKAAKLDVKHLNFTEVRRYLNLDGADSPLAHDESLQQFLKPSATGRIRDALLIDTSQLCGQGPDGVKGHDSIRILFRSIAKGLEPKLLLALPLRQGPRRKRGESSLLGMLTSCNYTSEKALCTDDVRAALKRNGKEKQVDLLLDNALLIDVVCARPRTGAGRGLVGELLASQLRMRRGSKGRRNTICAVAASEGGHRLFQVFGFHSIPLSHGFCFCWISLDELDAGAVERALTTAHFIQK